MMIVAINARAHNIVCSLYSMQRIIIMMNIMRYSSPTITPPCHYQSDEVWMNNCQKLMDLTGDLPLGLYETPVPKVRSLTPPMLKWIAETGRFVFHKDTSLDTQTMLSKMAAVKSVPSTPLK